MGRADNRRSLKSRRRKAWRRKKIRLKRKADVVKAARQKTK